MYFLLGNISDIFGGMLAIIGGLIIIAVIILLVVVGIIIAFLPTIIAFRRGHYYKWIIFAINFVCGVTGIGYLVALVWAFWPEKSTFTDVFHNDATTNSKSSNIDIFSKRTFTKKIILYVFIDDVLCLFIVHKNFFQNIYVFMQRKMLK